MYVCGQQSNGQSASCEINVGAGQVGCKLALCSGGILVQHTTTPSNGLDESNGSGPSEDGGGDTIAATD